MPEEKQRKKRIRVEKLNEWIETLKSIERVNRDSEYFKQNAIPYLEQYVDSLKEAAKGNDELTQQLADLQTKFDTVKTDADSKLSETQKDFAIKLALKDANALDENIILGLLDRDTIKVAENGLQGFTEQLETLKTDKSFLFAQETPAEPANPQITASGNPTGTQTPPTDAFNAAVDKFK